jgi:hypothetical protein
VATFALSHTPKDAKSAFDMFLTAADYQDCHAWVFTPSSFRLIASDLAAIGATGLREEGFWETPIFEFVTILSRVAAGCPVDRADLVVASHREAAEPSAPTPRR